MFSTFPDGWPGTGLILLRVVSGALVAIQGAAYVQDWSGRRIAWVLGLLAVGSGILLLLGCLTRVAALMAAMVCTGSLFSWLPASTLDIFASKLPTILVAVITLAVICLGPGAFSLDAILFGRRELVIPRNPHNSDF